MYLNKTTANLLFIAIAFVIAALLCINVEYTAQKHIELSKQKLLQEARAHFDNMVVMRSWNAMYGGVYVKQTGNLSPNPYLKDNAILDSEGNTLIKINPAWMTRQISELANIKSRYYYKITSLNPINPHNEPDDFEREALLYFKKYKDSPYYYQLTPDNNKFNFMGALKIEPECLACHENQGYKVGDIRGGIRVSIPSDLYLEEVQTLAKQKHNSLIFIIVFTLFILAIFLYFIYRIYKHQYHIEQLNKSLEKTVKERTHRLEKQYQHEKYIKNLLKTVSNVNELLFNSISVQSVLKNSVEQLSKHKYYRFTWLGIIHNDFLEITSKTTDLESNINKTRYSLKEVTQDDAMSSALSAINEKRTVITPYLKRNMQHTKLNYQGKLYWLVAIPLLVNDSEQVTGVFTIYSDRKEGFESEEISVLEKLATDIALILHSYKQKAILEQMEMDKISNYEETILAFVDMIEQRDTYTAGHTLRVAEYCKKIAIELNISAAEIKQLERAAILHDIGKIATPDAVLLKPGKLTPLEYELIKQHAYAGYKMLSKIDMYKDLAEIIRYHHARYDGSGYPPTHSPDDVPFLSHIMVVADAFDAMTTNRIYKPRQTIESALAEIARYAGTQFHPSVSNAAIKVLANVELTETNQTPNSELEQKRFSYFFCDALTDLYNENYLQMILANNSRYHYLVQCSLNHFSHYNKTYGWESGNQLLIAVAKMIKSNFSEALSFRYHGDNFILLFEKERLIDDRYFEDLPLFMNTGIKATLKKMVLNEQTIYDYLL